jgi:hypothetical protein
VPFVDKKTFVLIRAIRGQKNIRAHSCHSWTKKFVPIRAIRGQKNIRANSCHSWTKKDSCQFVPFVDKKTFVLIRVIRGQKNSCQFVPFVDKKIIRGQKKAD